MERTATLQTHGFWLWAWEGGWGALPLVATGAGAWAFTESPPDFPALALRLGLVLLGWIPLWRALVNTDWATPLAQWQSWEGGEPLKLWPYLRPGTPGARFLRVMGEARAWWEAGAAMALSPAVRSTLLALGASLLLAWGCGRVAVLLTLLLLASAQLIALWHNGSGERSIGGEALAWVSLPWLLGASLTTEAVFWPLLSAIVLLLLVKFHAQASWTAFVGPLLAALFLLWIRQPVAAGLLLLLGLPGLWLLNADLRGAAYRRAVAPWLLAMVVLLASVL